MLRDGLISPRSKVIAALDTSGRPGSTMSNGELVLCILRARSSDLGAFSVYQDKDRLIQRSA